jgi:hypothetical protein
MRSGTQETAPTPHTTPPPPPPPPPPVTVTVCGTFVAKP